jgi:DNA gyrase subunit B
MAFLNKGPDDQRWSTSARPTTDDEDGKPREVTFMYEGGIVDFVRTSTRPRADPPTVIEFEEARTSEGMAVEIAMQWNESYGESVYTFANTINTHEGGTHEEGFRAALTTHRQQVRREKKLLKEKDENLTGEDIREGLTAIISVKLAEPQFEGQTKTKLGNTDMKGFVQKVANEQLADWFDSNPAEAKTRSSARRSGGPGPDRRAQGARAGPAQVAAGVGGSLPGKLADCQSTDPASASSSSSRATRPAARPSRAATRVPGDPADPRQDPQRREGPDRPGAEEQRGPGADHRARHRHPRRLRHRQAALPQDRADGRRRRRRPAHPTLLLTLLFRFMRPLVEAGHVYLAQPPLYKIKWNKRGDDASTRTPTGSATA